MIVSVFVSFAFRFFVSFYVNEKAGKILQSATITFNRGQFLLHKILLKSGSMHETTYYLALHVAHHYFGSFFVSFKTLPKYCVLVAYYHKKNYKNKQITIYISQARTKIK